MPSPTRLLDQHTFLKLLSTRRSARTTPKDSFTPNRKLRQAYTTMPRGFAGAQNRCAPRSWASFLDHSGSPNQAQLLIRRPLSGTFICSVRARLYWESHVVGITRIMIDCASPRHTFSCVTPGRRGRHWKQIGPSDVSTPIAFATPQYDLHVAPTGFALRNMDL